ncbi:hypothetical protein [Paraburkholderia sp. GAS334]|uniref:hypothetical protein n=1 Tax=Paraburkholderia sp. GAS334 TaxID=3035131 RepID=UPI003D22336B
MWTGVRPKAGCVGEAATEHRFPCLPDMRQRIREYRNAEVPPDMLPEVLLRFDGAKAEAQIRENMSDLWRQVRSGGKRRGQLLLESLRACAQQHDAEL